MKDLFVPYEQALQLKELGMDLDWDDYLQFYDSSTKEFCDIMKDVSAPLKIQVLKWFREKYALIGTPQYFTGGYYCFTINDMKDTKESNRLFTEYPTYEEAEMACINKLIEIIKTQ